MASNALRLLHFALLFYYSLRSSSGRQILLSQESQNISIASANNPSHTERNEAEYILQTDAISNSINKYVVYRTNNGAFYGLQAKFSVWSFPVGPYQHTMALIDLSNGLYGDYDDINTIQVGWHIYPSLYADYDPHFFVRWTVDGFSKTGCYNLICPGFVLSKNATSIPGAKLWPLSSYGGTQYYAHYKLFKDSKTGDWWIYEGANTYSNPVGHFPQSLFSSLAHNASNIMLGGHAIAINNGITPPMGSGRDASEGYGKAADFEDIQYVEKTGETKALDEFDFTYVHPSLKCYTGTRMKVTNGNGSFYYGGPGNC